MTIALEDDNSMLEETVVIGYGRPSKTVFRHKNRSVDAGRKSKHSEPLAAEASVPDDYDFSSVSVRKIFSESLAFEPFLRPENGEVSFKFKTSDKLSTYHVLFFAHDKAMRNATLTKDFTVTVPVKVSVAAPRYLYSGDKWSMAATVTGNSDAVIEGEMKILEYSDKGEAIDSLRVPVTVKGGEQSVVSFPVDVPSATDSLTFKVIFASKSFSDAVQFGVPVHDASQVITESHSAIALPGADKEKLLESLRSRFVNVSSAGAVCDEISIGKMIEEAAAQKSEPAANDALSLTEAYCFKSFKSESVTSLLGRILVCRNSDGGFGWFEGMRSSQSVTATVLDRMALVAGIFPILNLPSSIWIPPSSSASRAGSAACRTTLICSSARTSRQLDSTCGWTNPSAGNTVTAYPLSGNMPAGTFRRRFASISLTVSPERKQSVSAP